MQYVTLYAAQPTPAWAEHIVKYLTQGILDKNMPYHRRKALEVESKNYTMIGNQLYRRGIDSNLRLCVCEDEYIPILSCVHAGASVRDISLAKLQPNK